MGTETTRRGLLKAVGTMLVAAQSLRIANGAAPTAGRASAAGVRLQPLPTRAFKTRDPGSERTESWTIWVIVETSTPRELTIQSATTQFLSNGKVVRSTRDEGDSAHVLSIVPPFSPRLPDGRESPMAVTASAVASLPWTASDLMTGTGSMVPRMAGSARIMQSGVAP